MSGKFVVSEWQDGILCLTCDYPPVNALGQGLRRDLLEGIKCGQSNARARAILVHCAGTGFFAGADISEFDGPEPEPTADELFTAIEQSKIPVIAAMHGRALGGGLEIALTCHGRIAVEGTRLGLPEVRLGLIPGLGGTQRLPRLIGLERSVQMITSGQDISAKAALECGLIDSEIPPGCNLFEQVESWLRANPSRPLVREMPMPEMDAALLSSAANRARRQKRNAPSAALDAIEFGAKADFDAGLKQERALFDECYAAPEADAMMHLFFAERQARKIPDLPQAGAVTSVGVVGGGTMGAGIALASLGAGLAVTLIERDADAASRTKTNISNSIKRSRDRGRISPADAYEQEQKLTCTTEWASLASCELIIEAVFEDLQLKRDLFQKLDQVAGKDAILASNTSALSIKSIAQNISRPHAALGLHFFSPAHIMKLLEIVRTPDTSDAALSMALAFARKLGKVAVVSADSEGFIGNRIFDAWWDEAERMVETGTSPYDVDAALVDFGMAMGPFAVSDLSGLDIGHAMRKKREAEGRFGPQAEEQLFRSGRLGQKNGKGWYDYSTGKRLADPEVMALLYDFRAGRGISDVPTPKDQIAIRCLAALVHETHKVLEEGVARRASDIDLVAVHGYGFPEALGGPMHWAERHNDLIIPWIERLEARPK